MKHLKHLHALMLCLATGTALAHPGHGLPGAGHWHAPDVALWLGLVVLAAWWLLRRK